ncbi:hydrogenase, partial [Salmonella enterica subsp. enterica]|nr:hydrogenase [Salmonella enterica subsp. enterica]
MTKFDEAMLAPPEDNMMAETISGLLQRLTPQSGKESLLQAFMPLLPPFSAVQLIELHFPGNHVWYRCFEEGISETAAGGYQGTVVDCSLHAVLLSDMLMAEIRFIRTKGSKFSVQDSSLFNWLVRIMTPVLESLLGQAEQQATLHTLIKERDHHRVLVDITNAVLTHRDRDELIADVAREIHHFFGITSVGMVLHDNRPSAGFVLDITHFSPTPAERLQRPLAVESALMQRISGSNQHALLHQAEDPLLWQHDPLLQDLHSYGLSSAL